MALDGFRWTFLHTCLDFDSSVVRLGLRTTGLVAALQVACFAAAVGCGNAGPLPASS